MLKTSARTYITLSTLLLGVCILSPMQVQAAFSLSQITAFEALLQSFGVDEPTTLAAATTLSTTPAAPVCGPANGTTVSSAPTADLCPSGTIASGVSGSGPWSWSCSGTDIKIWSSSAMALGTAVTTFSAGGLSMSAGTSTTYTLANGYILAMQDNGNFVLYTKNRAPLWSTKTGGSKWCSGTVCNAVFQSDGNFVLYKDAAHTKPYWSSNTSNSNGSKYQLRVYATAPYIGIVLPNVTTCSANKTPEPEVLTGSTDSITTDTTGTYAMGWVCAKNNEQPLSVQIYATDPTGARTLIATQMASLPSTTDTAQTCGAGLNHNFKIQVSTSTLFKHESQPVYAYALSPTIQSTTVLPGSGATLPTFNPAPANPKVCIVLNGDPNKCFSSVASYDVLSFGSDYTCSTTGSCCGAGTAAANGTLPPLIAIYATHHKTILGNGYTIHRAAGQALCSAIQIIGSQEILVDTLSLDENEATPPCEVSNSSCKNTIQIQSDTDVKLNKVNIYYGKGYVLNVWNTNGFSFTNSALAESGIIGLYIGHYLYGSSTNITIANSVFAKSRTNGIALQGVYANSPSDPALVVNNILTKNHWHGLWLTDQTKYPAGSVTSGGQLLVGDTWNMRIKNNIVADGYCENCYPGPNVAAIEVGDVAPAPAGVSGLSIDTNYIYDGGTNTALYQNPGSLVSSVQINNNRIVGFSSISTLPLGTGNILGDTTPSLSQKGTAPYIIYRESNGTTHWEAKVPGELSGSGVEAAFGLSTAPRVNAPARPLFRCFNNTNSMDDFLSTDQNCNGIGTLHSVVE